MSNNCVGHVSHYFDHLHVAALTLERGIRVGDWLHITGHTTDFVQQVVSLQINHQSVPEAGPGQDVALRVNDRVREHDAIYHITAEEARAFESEASPDRAW
jgi:putative protease